MRLHFPSPFKMPVEQSTLSALVLIFFSMAGRLIFLNSYSLVPEEAYYWNYAQHLDFGYLDHPPLVALIIKSTTTLFGTNEIAVRMGSMLCWLGTAFFVYRLTELITKNAGIYAVMLFAILPYFYFDSLMMTPDQPLAVCWSASLFYLYRALILKNRSAWYAVGFWIGLGLCSKYTIFLVGLSTFVYVLQRDERQWFLRKEPYLALIITILVFSPVIYWNATHQWVSFLFQSSERFSGHFKFTFPLLFVFLLFFLTPLGVKGLWDLAKVQSSSSSTKKFIAIYTLVPLLFFAFFSLTRLIKFNWIGTGLLAILPWLATEIHSSLRNKQSQLFKQWRLTAIILLGGYFLIMSSLVSGFPTALHKTAFKKLIDWQQFTQQLYQIATTFENKEQMTPVFVPLDLYNINSELAFYQAKLLAEKKIPKIFSSEGRILFGQESLMYNYWSTKKEACGQSLILISHDSFRFDGYERIRRETRSLSPIEMLWGVSQGKQTAINPFYYRLVKLTCG